MSNNAKEMQALLEELVLAATPGELRIMADQVGPGTLSTVLASASAESRDRVIGVLSDACLMALSIAPEGNSLILLTQQAVVVGTLITVSTRH